MLSRRRFLLTTAIVGGAANAASTASALSLEWMPEPMQEHSGGSCASPQLHDNLRAEIKNLLILPESHIKLNKQDKRKLHMGVNCPICGQRISPNC